MKGVTCCTYHILSCSYLEQYINLSSLRSNFISLSVWLMFLKLIKIYKKSINLHAFFPFFGCKIQIIFSDSLALVLRLFLLLMYGNHKLLGSVTLWYGKSLIFLAQLCYYLNAIIILSACLHAPAFISTFSTQSAS